MVKVEDAVIAKLMKNGQKFEILVDCELALKLKHGENVSIRDVLAVDNVFKDSKKGEIASHVEEIFKTTNIEDIAKEIILHGEVPLTTEYKRKLTEEKRKRVIGLISQNALDPRTKYPIPPQRIENALEQAKVHFDPFKSAEEQMKEIIEKLRPILPISFEAKKYNVLIPAQYAAAVYGTLKKYGKITSENWLNNGSLHARVEMPAGMSSEFIDKMNKATHGDVQIDEEK
jgi:ribosome maturation protein SDO1